MLCHASSSDLAAALNTVTRIIPPQNPLAITTGVQCEATGNQLRVSATDLVHHLTVTIPATVDEPGIVVLPAATFHALMRRLPSPVCTLATQAVPSPVTVRYGRNRATLQSFGPDTLPEFPTVPLDTATVTFPPDTLPRLTRALLFACATDETRPILKGISIVRQDDQLIAVATDGSRLSLVTLAFPDALTAAPFSAVFAVKTLNEAARLNSTDPLNLRWTADLVEWTTPTATLRARLLDGSYPDYDRVIPTEYGTTCRLALADLRNAVERMQILSDPRVGTPLAVTVRAGALSLAAESATIGQAQETLDCDTTGPDFAIIFNPAYLAQALRSFDGEDILWEFSGVQAPARLRDPADASYFHIVLPLRQLI